MFLGTGGVLGHGGANSTVVVGVLHLYAGIVGVVGGIAWLDDSGGACSPAAVAYSLSMMAQPKWSMALLGLSMAVKPRSSNSWPTVAPHTTGGLGARSRHVGSSSVSPSSSFKSREVQGVFLGLLPPIYVQTTARLQAARRSSPLLR